MIHVGKVLITTKDNPYDQIEDFANWYREDRLLNANSWEYVMRIANLRDDMSEEEKDFEIERAIDEIVLNDPLDRYKKVVLPPEKEDATM